MSPQRLVLVCFISFWLGGMALAQCPPQPNCATPLLPLVDGMTASTVSSALPGGSQQHVVIVTDARNPAANAPGLDVNWYAPNFSNQLAPTTAADEWTKTNLGEVFGICLDDQPSPNIYVAATTIYTSQGTAAGGPGGIYKLDGNNGDICVVASLPNGGAGLGNICFDRQNDQFFAVNLDDGLIYRFVGAELPCGQNMWVSTYDHGVAGRNAQSLPPIPDDITQLVTQPGRRVFAVQKHPIENRLYYSVWWEDFLVNNPTENTEIWSVGLDSNGEFVAGSAVREVILTGNPDLSMPVLDIAFDPTTCDMLVAERTMYGVIAGTSAHQSRVLVYSGSTTAWVPAACPKYDVGLGGNNATGGLAVDCDGMTFAVGDFIHGGLCDRIYGLQLIAPGGNCGDSTPTSNAYLIDLDCDTVDFDKFLLGDVEVVAPECVSCTKCTVRIDEVLCGTNNDYSLTVTVTNGSGVDADRIKLVPQGSFTMTPDTIITPVPDGSSHTLNTTITGANAGDMICFEVWLLTADLEQCCVVEACVKLPSCCLCILNDEIICLPDGTFQYTFDLQNKLQTDIDRIFLWPDPVGSFLLTPDEFLLATPIPFNGITGPHTTIIAGPMPGETICIEFTIHNSVTGECCGEKITIELPDCDPCDIPDSCEVPEVTSFCQNGDVLTAEFTLRICNNCAAAGPTEYLVDLDGLAGCGDAHILDPTSFSPNNFNTGPIPPGECLDFTITVTAFIPSLAPGQCTCFQVHLTNLATGITSSCDGRICLPQGIKVDPGDPDPVGVEVGVATPVDFLIENLTGQVTTVDVTISTFIPGEPVGAPNNVSLDGLPPGEPVVRTVKLPPGAVVPTPPVAVSILDHEPFVFYDIILMVDSDGDGDEEPQASQSVFSRIAVDCNMNGVDDDIDILVGNSLDEDGDGVPDECGGGIPLAPSFLRGDSNGDMFFDITDPIHLLGYVFAGGSTPPCLSAADTNMDAVLAVDDVLCMLAALFNLGPDPSPPYPGCGQAQPSPLGCAQSSCP